MSGTGLPVVLLSHGHGPSNFLSSLHGYGPLANFLAAHGFVVLQPTHLDSAMLGLRDANAPEAPLYWRTRATDMSFILDHLDEVEEALPQLRGRTDRSQIAVVGQLSEVSELVDIAQAVPVQARLFVVMAELSKIIASMSYDSGDHSTAQKYYTLSLRAIHQAGPEHKLYGVGVLADMARQMLDTKNPREALDVSRIALDSAQAHNAPPTVQAMLRNP